MDNSILTISLIIISVVLFIATTVMAFALINKDEIIRQIKEAYDKLMRSFNDIDEQAKLIVKTDLELNKAQEELDKRLNGLNALQRASRQISQALNEGEIFNKLQPALFEELGFTKVIVVTKNDAHEFIANKNYGFQENRIPIILSQLLKDDVLNPIAAGNLTVSSINSTRKAKEKIIALFESEHFILTPIITQSGSIGFIFVGNRYTSNPVTQGDEELLAILAGQIGQALENAQLFEKVFRSSQELELKVKERTKQLAAVLSQVEEISQKKSEFISAVSHELRTPLTSIKGYAAILMAGKIGDIPDAVKERLAKINTHSDNLVSLINNLLDIARIESGRIEMKYALHKTKNIIDNIVDLLMPQINNKEINISIDIANNVNDIYIDSPQAERVFINLLSNAIKFTPKSGRITIGVNNEINDGYATFFVRDTGIGMSEDDLSKLFSEFFRAENDINQNVKGTGLGLVLAKNIILAHRGSIWVESKLNQGTTFFFTFPVSSEAFEKHDKKIQTNTI